MILVSNWRRGPLFDGKSFIRSFMILIPRSGALAATGIIWARYSMVIIPKNYNLLFVNIFVGATGLYQLSRIFNHRRSLEAAGEGGGQ